MNDEIADFAGMMFQVIAGCGVAVIGTTIGIYLMAHITGTMCLL